MKRLFNKSIENKTVITLVSLLIATIAFQSCKKSWLEAKVDKKQAVPSTVQDFQAMLDSYLIYNSSVGYVNEIMADGHYYTESTYSSFQPTNGAYNTYIWKNRVPNNSVADYSAPYSGILNSNIILEESRKSIDQDKLGLEQVKAQALFHRGRFFFELAETFAPQYTTSAAGSDLGIALRLNTDITESSVRSTVKQTYEQIISDLKNAKDVLPNDAAFLTRASKPAALGMLAKIYLSMGDYVNAFNYANEYLKIKSELLNYSSISSSVNFIGLNKEVAFFKIFPSTATLIRTQYLIDQALYDLYDNNDLRKQVFFRVAGSGITFKGYYSNSATDVFAGLATDEIYLIRAECFARNRNLTAAMKDLNDLLRTRWAKNNDGTTKYIDQTAIDETDALKKIFLERRKELILRGGVRWSDLRRLNLDDRFKITLTRTVGGQTYTLEPNGFRYTRPIPDDILSMSAMQQNLGW
jgi:hypothetical protein